MGSGSSKEGRIRDKKRRDFDSAMRTCNASERFQIVFAVDATSSNLHHVHAFKARSLHWPHNPEIKEDEAVAGDGEPLSADNPYKACMRAATACLAMDVDQKIPLIFFGSKEADAKGGVFEADVVAGRHLIKAYEEHIAKQTLGSTTSFVPAIRFAADLAKKEPESVHVLMILTDGTFPANELGIHLEALAAASTEPMCVVIVGLGDKARASDDLLVALDDRVRGRRFDNVQYVNYQDLGLSGVHNEDRRFDPSADDLDTFKFKAFMELPWAVEQMEAAGIWKKPPRP